MDGRALWGFGLSGVLFVLLVMVCGCASTSSTARASNTALGNLHIVQSGALDATQPLALGARMGMEHHAWLTDDTGDRVARVLSAFEEEPMPIEYFARERLRRSGFRVIAVPIEQVMDVHAALPPLLTWRREWGGQLTAWTELLRGRTIGERQRLIVDGQEMIMPAGTPRIIARCWVAPTPGGAVMRTEIGVQIHEASRRDPARAMYDPAAALTLQEQGRVLDAVTFRADLLPTHAIFIVSGSSDADWSAFAHAPVDDPTMHGEADAEESPEAAKKPDFEVLSGGDVIVPDAFGPSIEGTTELGVFMLSGLDRSYRPIKAVFVLIPRVPAQYTLLP